MTVNIERDFELITLGISGRLDDATAPSLEKIINELPVDTKDLVFNMSGLEYVSAEGIRVLLDAHKKINFNHGVMRIVKAGDIIRNTFEMTGLFESQKR